MKQFYKAFFAAAAVLLAVSCVNELGNDTLDTPFRKYSLSFEGDTKTELSGSGVKRKVNWNDGDEIRFFTEPNQTNPASASVNTDGDNAYVTIPRGRADEFINAVYGASQLNSGSSSENTIYVTSPVKNDQNYTSFSQVHLCAAFSDDIENPYLTFHNATAILKFTSSAKVSKIVFYGNNYETITGGGNGGLKITHSGGTLTVAPTSSSGTSVTVQTNGQATDFYMAILPVRFDGGITIDCYDANLELIAKKKTTNAINTVSASGALKILDLGNVGDWLNNPLPAAVDLGLSVKWARVNLGANEPEEYGDYYAWGETSPKGAFNWSNYTFGTSKNGPFSKYVLDADHGTIDHKTVLDLEDDAAHVKLGGDWRMPTEEEIHELMYYCNWTWTTRNGVPGYRVSRDTGQSIFLPANGKISGSSPSDVGTEGDYWSASLSADGSNFAFSPYFNSSNRNGGNCYRYFGLAIRPVEGEIVPVTEISISPSSVTFTKIGETQTLTATVLPENATYKSLTWVSSDESVATVDANGKVTSVSLGAATITAYSADGTKRGFCKLNKPVESITLDKTEMEIYVGDDPTPLTATVLPEDASIKALTWSSSNTSVAEVDSEGKVKAVSNGNATITVKTTDGSDLSASCAVTVYRHVKSVSLDKSELYIYIGQSKTLTATVLPSTSNKSVTWTSSDESVASVDQNGLVTAVSYGSTTITVTTTDGGYTANCSVTVLPPFINGHEFVDLGLPSGLKWATCNVGADKPEEYGDYFAWGETEPKSSYNWSTYKWCNGVSYKLTKYCIYSNFWDGTGSIDNKTVLDLEDDAAHVNWSGSWRMPTDEDWAELIGKCSWTWTSRNGVNGYKVTSKTNGNRIFLPAAGLRNNTLLYDAGSYGSYWSTSLNKYDSSSAYNVYFNSDYYFWNIYDRYFGLSVRPVSE